MFYINSLDTKLKYKYTHVVGGWGDTQCIMLRIVNTKPINGSPNIREGNPFKLTKETTISFYALYYN